MRGRPLSEKEARALKSAVSIADGRVQSSRIGGFLPSELKAAIDAATDNGEVRVPTPIDSLSKLSTDELISQLRDRITDLTKAPNAFSGDIHRGVALMLVKEMERRLT